MDKNTILQLNKLNKLFYEQIAMPFSETRSQAWDGWHLLLPYLKKITAKSNTLDVLDIGCGNGRFATFLQENFHQPFNYWGIDNNQPLLNIAKTKSAHLIKLDIVETLAKGQPLKIDRLPAPSLITLFGVMHHIPDQSLRIELLKQLSQLAKPDSLIIFTAWQFADDNRFQSKIINPQQLGINPIQLEKNDYILDWQKGQTAYRYCHHLNQAEIDQLLVEGNLELVASFQADGKTMQLNRYIIARPQLP